MVDVDQNRLGEPRGWTGAQKSGASYAGAEAPLREWLVFFVALLVAALVGGCATVAQEPAAEQADVLEEASRECDCEKQEAKQEVAAEDVQAPSEPQAIVSEEISFVSKGVELAGVVDRPMDVSEPLAAVVMLHDSGPMDRRGLFAGSLGLELPVEVPVYEELAENLAQNGYVVLRFDKRTCVEGGPPWCSYPREYIEDHREDLVSALLADAKAAVDHVRKRDDVDSTQVYLLGHGQGAELALALAKDVDAKGMVLLAPSPYPLDEVVLHQTEISRVHLEKRRKAEGNTTMGTLLQEQLDALEVSQTKQKQAFEKLRADELDQDDVLGAPKKTWAGLFELHDRAMAGLKNSTVPVLAVFGDQDLDLPSDSAEAFQTKLGRSPKSEVMNLEGLTHPMVAIDGGDEAETTQVSEDVHQAILHFFEQFDQAPVGTPGS
jgi:dienelactone hydrolase